MGIRTKIQWADSTANPIVGCDGCCLYRKGSSENHCYAASLVGRYAGLPGWPKSFDQAEFFERRIEKACRWPDLTGQVRPEKPWLNGYPRTIFLGDLGDVFTESLPLDWLGPYLVAMSRAPHIWILCTKRPRRARLFFERHGCPPNFWLLTTVTSAATINRVTELQRIPASVLGISYEPALGPIADILVPHLASLQWLICGSESGPLARPMDPQWACDVRDACAAAGTAFFMKQMRGPIPPDLLVRAMPPGK